MKVSDIERAAIFRTVLAQLVSRPASEWPTRPPPTRDGAPAKETTRPFAVACWADAFTRAAVAVLEKEPKGDPSAQSDGFG